MKMPKGRVITRSIPTPRLFDMTLNLECMEEPLSESQLMLRIKLKENYDRVAAALEELVNDQGGKLVCQAGTVNGYQYPTSGNGNTQGTVKTGPQGVLSVNQTKSQPIKLNVLNNSGAPPSNIQLVVDPRVGVILGQVPPQQGTPTSVASTITTTPPTTHTQQENYKYTRSGRRTKAVLQAQQVDVIEEPVPSVPPVLSTRGRPKSGGATHVVTPTTTSPQGVTNLRIKTVNKQQSSSPSGQKPTEHTSIGGISVGTKNSASEETDESNNKKNLPDSREVSFNKTNGGRTFPSLVVVARPNLRIKDIAPQVAQKERTELDIKVKNVLMFSATKFAEWLIQRGLVRSEQYCTIHSTIKLKLGMYSDQGTFPYSGGYVWISNCCPDRFVSVFSGSLFQGAPYTPTVLLKLVYHWACQTNVQNAVSWVKVSNLYVKNFYTNLRSVCTAALWDKCHKMGGENAMIQVGVISLGTTSQDGNLRQVKVEVLGVLDPVTLELRLRACDPVQDGDRSYKRRFNNILHPLKNWVHPDSRIMTDFTVDKSTLQEMGFNQVTQSAFSDQNARNFMSNYHIMEYLRKIVPRMFQNTLSLLSRQMIQQFLDELAWREVYGTTAARAFENIILHIAEQTRIDNGEYLMDRLAKIAANPFQDWSYSNNANHSSIITPVMTGCNQQEESLTTNLELPTQNLQNESQSQPQSESHSKSEPQSQSQQQLQQLEVPNIKSGSFPKRGRKRGLSTTSMSVDGVEPRRQTADSRPAVVGEKEKEKEREGEKENDKDKEKDKEKEKERECKSANEIQLQELFYATMEGEKSVALRQHKISISFKCFLCTTTMRSNTEVMEHTISHVPPQMPDHSESPVCRYCCTAFSSRHQMLTHVNEAHSNFGHSDSDMVACAICEQKFGNSSLLIDHLSSMHYPSEMPYRCESCGYRTSSHKDAVDHFYRIHERDEGLQCPYCLKVVKFVNQAAASLTCVHAFLLHMQRHVIRKEQGRGNKCSRCCLWFNQKSHLKLHQRELHDVVSNSKVTPYSVGDSQIMVSRQRIQNRRFDVDSPVSELPDDERLRKWPDGPITVNIANENLSCQECEEDIEEENHYPGEQKCRQCRYVTCCWRAFKEHQQQIHNERPMTGLIVLSPLINIPLERKMRCLCGYATTDGNQLATHLVKCKKVSAYPADTLTPTGMLDSLGLVPKSTADNCSPDTKESDAR